MTSRTLLAAALLSTTLAATAKQPEPANWKTTCDAVASLSETIMRARQDGVSLRDMLSTADNTHTESLIIEAYKQPYYHTLSMKTQAIKSFEDQVYLMCVQQYRQ